MRPRRGRTGCCSRSTRRRGRQDESRVGSRTRAAYAVMAHIALWAGNEDPAPLAREALAEEGGTKIARIIAFRVLAFDAARRGERAEGIGFAVRQIYGLAGYSSRFP